FYNYLILVLLCTFFFFSSRRRHTISKRDWSSDVCSSDLREVPPCTPDPGWGRGGVGEDHRPGGGGGPAGGLCRCGGGLRFRHPRSEERRVGKECRVRVVGWWKRMKLEVEEMRKWSG